jgi:mannose-6-phosphate isomerase-like protein (cupin superfamily)
MIETIMSDDKRIALIISSQFGQLGTQFATQAFDGLQVGAIVRKTGDVISAHRHLPINIQYHGAKQEFIYIVDGEVTVKFFDEENKLVAEKILKSGDAMLQICGGHQFDFQQNTRMIEVKQGPYTNKEMDKVFI